MGWVWPGRAAGGGPAPHWSLGGVSAGVRSGALARGPWGEYANWPVPRRRVVGWAGFFLAAQHRLVNQKFC
jgi:hypothetical protein